MGHFPLNFISVPNSVREFHCSCVRDNLSAQQVEAIIVNLVHRWLLRRGEQEDSED